MSLIAFSSNASETFDTDLGRAFPFENVKSIVSNKTTKQEVLDLLGEPYKISKVEGGVEHWLYKYKDSNTQIWKSAKVTLWNDIVQNKASLQSEDTQIVIGK
jgi:hypothetical protein